MAATQLSLGPAQKIDIVTSGPKESQKMRSCDAHKSDTVTVATLPESARLTNRSLSCPMPVFHPLRTFGYGPLRGGQGLILEAIWSKTAARLASDQKVR